MLANDYMLISIAVNYDYCLGVSYVGNPGKPSTILQRRD